MGSGLGWGGTASWWGRVGEGVGLGGSSAGSVGGWAWWWVRVGAGVWGWGEGRRWGVVSAGVWGSARMCAAVHVAVCCSARGSVWQCVRQCAAVRQCARQCVAVQRCSRVRQSGSVHILK